VYDLLVFFFWRLQELVVVLSLLQLAVLAVLSLLVVLVVTPSKFSVCSRLVTVPDPY